ncbi:hypothetical protein EJB05_16180, partial [Eragrostis curvula]
MAAAGVMVSMEQGDPQSNLTSALEALSPWLNNPRRTVIQVEVFMAAAAVLLFFLLIFGSVRRRTNNLFIQKGLWLAYTLLPPLITYTLGQMQSSPVKSALYPVWGLSLVLVAGGANSLTAYDLDDNKQWKRHIFDLLQFYIYIGLLFELLYPDKSLSKYYLFHFSPSVMRQPVSIPLFFLVGSVFIANMFGIIAGWMVNHSDASKVVADYMKDQANSRGGFDPVSMKDCKYLVRWPTYRPAAWRRRGESPVYRSELPEEDIITVGMVWEMCNTNEDSLMSQGVSSRIKGACLSFALSHLLRRRFFGMACAEASLSETRQFVLQGLLRENNSDEYTGAFKVIEVELGFLYDSFYTKYASIFEMESGFFFVVIMKIISTFVVGIILLFKSPIIKAPNPIIQVGTRTADIIITVVILGTFIAVEVLQSILYLGTDWAMVSLACYYNKGRRHGRGLGCIPFALHKTCAFLGGLPSFKYWQNNIGQYSVIQGSRYFRGRKAFACLAKSLFLFSSFEFMVYATWDTLRNLFPRKGLHFVKLPDTMKNEIVSALKSNSDDHLTNGKASLLKNGVFEQFSWTLSNESQIEIMLIWHIATDYCKIALCDEAEEIVRSAQEGEKQYREVATKLSNYCAYLMSEVPELLPGNFADTKFVFHSAVFEAREALGTKTRNRDGLLEAMARPGQDDTIFVKGLKLGTTLESIPDSVLRWRVMAEFWAETILYIAPSDNAKAHMERLAQGGEFLTHIWALLTHAGILSAQRPILLFRCPCLGLVTAQVSWTRDWMILPASKEGHDLG